MKEKELRDRVDQLLESLRHGPPSWVVESLKSDSHLTKKFALIAWLTALSK